MSTPFSGVRRPLAPGSIAELGQKMIFRLPGCSDEEIRRALQAAYSDFCRLTLCYRANIDIELEPGESEYPVTAYMPDCFVDSVTEVRIGRRRLEAGRDYRLVPGSAFVMLVLDGRFVPEKYTAEQIAARPELSRIEPETLTVETIELPRLNAERAPRWFFDKYGEGVVAGALVKLFGMANKPWTDGVQAQHELIRWENYLTDARLRGMADDRSICGSGTASGVDTSVLL